MLEPVTSFALPSDCALPACAAALGDLALQSPGFAEECAKTQAKHKRVSRRQIQAPLKGSTVSHIIKKPSSCAVLMNTLYSTCFAQDCSNLPFNYKQTTTYCETAEPHQLQGVRAAPVKTSPGLQPHLRGVSIPKPQQNSSPACCNRRTSLAVCSIQMPFISCQLCSVANYFSAGSRGLNKCLPHKALPCRVFFQSSIPFPQCLIPVMKSTSCISLALKPALTYLGCSCPPAARQLPSYSAWRDLRYNY